MYQIYFHINDSLEIYSNNLDEFESKERVRKENEITEEKTSPAEIFSKNCIDLNTALNKNPSSTFFCRIKKMNFADEGVSVNDLLIIDKSVAFSNGKIVLCLLNDEFFIRRISIGKDAVIWLQSANESNVPVKLTKDNKSLIWGVIVHVIRTL